MEVDQRNLPLHRESQADVVGVARIRSSAPVSQQAVVSERVIVRARFTLDDRDGCDADRNFAQARFKNSLRSHKGNTLSVVIEATRQHIASERSALGSELRLILDLRRAVRSDTFDERGLEPPREVTTLTFREFADIYKQRHVQAKGLAIAKTIDYRLKPLIDQFGDRALVDIKTADIEDFIADLKLPRLVNRQPNRTLSPASVNRVIELMRHMMNWAVGREYLERTPFRRGTETLIRKQHEDNQRRRRLAEEEETRLLAVAPRFLRSMIIAAPRSARPRIDHHDGALRQPKA